MAPLSVVSHCSAFPAGLTRNGAAAERSLRVTRGSALDVPPCVSVSGCVCWLVKKQPHVTERPPNVFTEQCNYAFSAPRTNVLLSSTWGWEST